jgi:glucokinase
MGDSETSGIVQHNFAMYLGIEIGGTKLQLGLGAGDGVLASLWRGRVNAADGADGIRRQIVQAVPELLVKAAIDRGRLKGIGIGFGGPVDDATRTVIKSHQIDGWDHFPLADWIADLVGLPAVLGNDADVAGLAEALFGAGKGYSPVFYITIGSGIGGGLIVGGEIYRGGGKGAAEIGHLRQAMVHEGRQPPRYDILEHAASGWAIERAAQDRFGKPVSVRQLGEQIQAGDEAARTLLDTSLRYLAEAICQVIALLCPRRIVIGGGVALLGEDALFVPLRRFVAERVFKPFADCCEIVPASLGEEMVVHGALAMARLRLAPGGAANDSASGRQT